MELKNYQKEVIHNLRAYLKALASLSKGQNLQTAWEHYWQSRDIAVGKDGVPFYRDEIKGVPHICMKVPTGGGKTFLACAALQEIFSTLQIQTNRMVVWLVPSRPILQQTLRNLQDTNHPYRQLLDRDFQGRVNVLTKDMMLQGQNFSPNTVRDMLTICVLSYDSLRIDKLKKEERKVYQENGYLKSFSDAFANKSEDLLQGTNATALIQALRHLKPVTVVDESHNAESDLSVNMLNNLNPSFVLDLTATPREKSNIISYVDARELKKENMVKLPVVVYNRSSKQDVYQDAIQLRSQLETIAIEEQRQGGKYIRPIVLFQAQPHNKKEEKDKDTFERVREALIKMGIPKEQIAIKTANIDELEKQDLLSPNCEIRYIITVNALKEGWDCPFAYVLASLANKTSRVDVEQVLGRILRQPYAKRSRQNLLNASYVLTCSNDFYTTLEEIVKGLNHAGFSDKDYRAVNEPLQPLELQETPPPEQMGLNFSNPIENMGTQDVPVESPKIENEDDIVNPLAVREYIETTDNTITPAIQTLLDTANANVNAYDRDTEKAEANGSLGGELASMVKQQHVQKRFRQEIKDLRLPMFAVEKTRHNLFDDFVAENDWKLLTQEQLSKGFSLAKLPADINFELSTGDIFEVDLSKEDGVPKYRQASLRDREIMREVLARLPEEARIHQCELKIAELVNRNNRYASKDVNLYVHRVIENMKADEISALEHAYPAYARKIQDKIQAYERLYQEKQFKKFVETGKIKCHNLYKFPLTFTASETINSIPKSLYTAERKDMNSFEIEAINRIVGLDNIVWWHRIIDRKENEFYLNGFIHHYPDFVIQTLSGKIVLVETKGEHLANDDSRTKLWLGKQWASLAGEKYRYFMVFREKEFAFDGAYSLDDFISILHEL